MNMKLRNIPFSPPDMTEAEAKEVREAILSGWITTGPRTKKLEAQISEYVHTDKTVCLNSATAALEMVLHLMDIQPDDEVIVPAYTYTATASVTQHVGCKLVLVDSQKDNVEMDYDKLAAAITEKLQAKIGRIVVSADCAHSFGAWRNVNLNCSKTDINDNLNDNKVKKMAGEIADFSSFSFHAVKNFTTAEGGALTWNLPFGNEEVNVNVNVKVENYLPNVPKKEGETWNELLYRLSQLFSLHGQNKDALAKTKLGAWEYDIIGPWYKCNMTDIMAALGLVQMERYPSILNRRYEIVKRYNAAIDDLNVNLGVNVNDNLNLNKGVAYLNHMGEDHCSSHHLYIVRLLGKTREDANKVIEQMAERGIACNVHYKPLPMMTAYKALGFDIKEYPNAYHLFENEITLPLHTKLSDEDVDYVISNFVEIVREL